MISIDTARQIIEAIKPRRIALLGDPKQLPCMEGYSVLGTLLAMSGLPIYPLTRNHRQKRSALMRTIGALGIPLYHERMPETDDAFQVIRCETKEEVLQRVVSLYVPEQTQMLAFTNSVCATLNAKTRNTKTAEVGPGINVGDRIVCTKNIYGKKDPSSIGVPLLVANGVIGKVKTSNLIIYENGFRDTARKKHGFRSEFVAARAMTVHKSQGNEFSELGLIVVGGWHKPPLEFIYTALSRFKGKVYVVGTRQDIRDTFQSEFRPIIDRGAVRYYNQYRP
jgi:hypothetical protein